MITLSIGELVSQLVLVETSASKALGLDLPHTFTLLPGSAFAGRMVLVRAQDLKAQMDRYHDALYGTTVHRSKRWEMKAVTALFLRLSDDGETY